MITPTPVSVWVTGGGLFDCPRPGHQVGFGEPPCAWRWPDTLWESIITAYSRPGDRVRVSDAGRGTVVKVAHTLGRKITVPAASRRRDRAGRQFLDALPGQLRERISLPGAGRHSRPSDEAADLLIITPPCPADQPQPVGPTPSAPGGSDQSPTGSNDDPVLGHQLAALSDAPGHLAPGAVVVVLTRITPNPDGAVDRIGPLVSAAQAVGLGYLQHDPILHATLWGGRIHPHFGPDDPVWHLPYPGRGPVPWVWAEREGSPTGYDGPPVGLAGALHMPVHSDLIVFRLASTSVTQPGGAQ